jgi:hypothetical protein
VTGKKRRGDGDADSAAPPPVAQPAVQPVVQPAAQPGSPPNEANEFVSVVIGRMGPRFLAAADPGGNNRKKLVKLVGFLDVKPGDPQPRRLYLDDALRTGVDVPNEAILFWQTVEPQHHDGGLRQDAIWVVEDADLTYWSKVAPRPCAPEGGGGFPPTYRL